MIHYLDNSATTMVSEDIAKSVLHTMTNEYGNPASVHEFGYRANALLEKARETVAKSIGAQKNEIYFTSGGTEGNNQAILGTAELMKKRGRKIVTTSVEHSSVIESMKYLESKGFEVIFLNPIGGNINEEQIFNAVDENTILVSMMTVNNETGAIFPADKIKSIIKRKKSPALFHTDFVQGYGKMPISVKRLGCDILTVSGHKIHGPKGVGAIYLKGGKNITKIKPRLFGGEQEQKFRPGTEALPNIAGMAKAVENFDIDKNYQYIKELNIYARKCLGEIEGVTFNSTDDSLPYIINISTNCVKSQTMLNYLSSKGIYVSSGSACAKGKLSYALVAFGLNKREADSAIRISFSKYSTKEDIDALCRELKTGIRTLVHF
ncbi:MAG: cysteine desulfurase family protein [Acutalibacteraceae bacterium]